VIGINLKALALLTAGHFVTDINTGALPALLPFLKDHLRLSYAMTASIILTFNITSSVVQPIFGYFSDRWSTRWLLPAGCLIAPLGLALLALGSAYGWVLLFTGISGFGQASYHPEAFKTVNVLGGERKATAISLFLLGGNLGLSFGPFLGTLFYKYFGVTGSLFFLPLGFVMITIFFLTPSWKIKIDLLPSNLRGPEITGGTGKIFLPMALLLITVILRSAANLGILTFVPFYFIQYLHREAHIAGQYLSIFLLAASLGALAGGPVADRYGYKKTVIVTLGIGASCLYLFYLTGGAWAFIFLILSGFILCSSNAITMAMGQSFMPKATAMASALILGLSMGVGGIIVTGLGWVADHWGIIWALQGTFLLPIMAFLIFSFVPYPSQPQTRG
jgi:FSR family fosmidomycin resistance protein-like MFS transporter